jgi:catechol 2,3-dioxygenase-like lactoylglutathione lyase family enzyme
MLVGAALLRVALAQNAGEGFRAVNHIGIVVEDYATSLDFYTNVLGAKVAYTVSRPDGGPLLTYLQLNRETFVELIPARPGERTGVSHFGMEVGSIDSVIADLRRHGIAVADASRSPAQALMTRVRDPDQVEIEVMQYGPESSQRKAMDAWQGPSRP